MSTHTLTINRLRKLENATRIPALAAIFVYAALQVTRWGNRRRTRTHLSQLDDRMLRDVGITPAQAQREAEKGFWQL
ncbi:MAG: DUF1127 domain-containing protein [Pseudomonadota bacterium]